jgi:hypothetical protein
MAAPLGVAFVVGLIVVVACMVVPGFPFDRHVRKHVALIAFGISQGWHERWRVSASIYPRCLHRAFDNAVTRLAPGLH